MKQQWVIPLKANAEFVAAMEDMLDVYAMPYDPKQPVICVEEGGKQLIGDVREPLPVRPGSPTKEDHQDQRNGMANLFMTFEPLAGRRHVEVTERKRATDFARFLKRVCDEWYPAAKTIVLVCDNLNPHGPSALFRTFEPSEARRLCQKLSWHHTPKHGSWWNMAEIE